MECEHPDCTPIKKLQFTLFLVEPEKNKKLKIRFLLFLKFENKIFKIKSFLIKNKIKMHLI